MKIKFKTVSSVILSGRSSSALYKGVDFKEVNDKDINIIYPFYSYQNRNNIPNRMYEKANSYYIPASSLKGSLLVARKENENNFKEESLLRNKFIFRDILINKEQIVLDNLMKFQYLYQELKESNESNKKPSLECFFPTLGIEMMKHDTEFIGNIIVKDTVENLEKRLNETFLITNKKLLKYIIEIDLRIQKTKELKIEKEKRNITISTLEEIKKNINHLIKSGGSYVFLGGYKGIISSLTEDYNKIIKNGFYIDYKTKLPYGIVEVIN